MSNSGTGSGSGSIGTGSGGDSGLRSRRGSGEFNLEENLIFHDSGPINGMDSEFVYAETQSQLLRQQQLRSEASATAATAAPTTPNAGSGASTPPSPSWFDGLFPMQLLSSAATVLSTTTTTADTDTSSKPTDTSSY
jgi:hypothetical protein